MRGVNRNLASLLKQYGPNGTRKQLSVAVVRQWRSLMQREANLAMQIKKFKKKHGI
jgi:hypothetical protein